MSGVPLAMFTARVCGRDASVRVLPGRIEWSSPQRPGITEIVPMPAILSARTSRDGVTRWKVIIATRGDTTEFRVDRAVAEQVLVVISRLLAVPLPTKKPVTRGGRSDEFYDERVRMLGY